MGSNSPNFPTSSPPAPLARGEVIMSAKADTGDKVLAHALDSLRMTHALRQQWSRGTIQERWKGEGREALGSQSPPHIAHIIGKRLSCRQRDARSNPWPEKSRRVKHRWTCKGVRLSANPASRRRLFSCQRNLYAFVRASIIRWYIVTGHASAPGSSCKTLPNSSDAVPLGIVKATIVRRGRNAVRQDRGWGYDARARHAINEADRLSL
jgi:hypothetical protein